MDLDWKSGFKAVAWFLTAMLGAGVVAVAWIVLLGWAWAIAGTAGVVIVCVLVGCLIAFLIGLDEKPRTTERQ